MKSIFNKEERSGIDDINNLKFSKDIIIPH